MTTIKDLADQLQVSKPTITNVISALGILPTRSGNKYILSGDQVEQITTQNSKMQNRKMKTKNRKMISKSCKVISKSRKIKTKSY